jgi:NADH:ubiquinone oxidoreductase subunit H
MSVNNFDSRAWLPRLWKHPFSKGSWHTGLAGAAALALAIYLARLAGPLEPRAQQLHSAALAFAGSSYLAGKLLWCLLSAAALAAWTVFAAAFSLWIADKTTAGSQRAESAASLLFGWLLYPALWLKSLSTVSAASAGAGGCAPAAASAAFFMAFAAPSPPSGGAPLLWLLCAGTIFHIAVLHSVRSSGTVSTRLGVLRAARQFAACEAARITAAACAMTYCGGATLSAATEGQSGLWFGVAPRWFLFFPVAGQLSFFVYAAASLAICRSEPFSHPAGSEIYGGWPAGGRPIHHALAEFARGANIFICAYIGAALFLGGTGNAAGFVPGWFALLFKTFLLAALLGFCGAAFAPAGPRAAERFGWKILLPLALFSFAATGVWLWLK